MSRPLQKLSVGLLEVRAKTKLFHNFLQMSAQKILQRLRNGEDLPCPLYFQIVGSKRLPPKDESDMRCRLVISDGLITHGFAMLSAPMNVKYANGEFETYSIIRVNRFVPSRVNRTECSER
jgi:hypothetical protein